MIDKPTPSRGAIYARISQDREGTGAAIARQLEDCRALAQRVGVRVTAELVDSSISAYSGAKRPRFIELCEGIRNGRFDAVIVFAQDRLYRRVRDLLEYLDLCEARDVPTYFVREGKYDLTGSNGRLQLTVGAAFAEAESRRKGERHQHANLQRARAGLPHVTRRAFGSDADGIAHVEEEAEAIRWAFAQLRDGGSLRSIAQEWNSRGLYGPQKGRMWLGSVVRRTLLSPRLAGMRVHKGELVRGPDGTPIKAKWEPIVDVALWHTVKAILEDPKRRTNTHAWSPTLLAGVATCGECGEAVVSGGTRKTSRGVVRRYRCGGAHLTSTTVKRTCFHREAGPVDEYVIRAVLGRLADPETQRDISDEFAVGHGPDSGQVLAAITSQEQLREQMAEDMATGLLSRTGYLAADRQITTEVERLQALLAPQATNRVVQELRSAQDLRATWDGMDVADQRALIREIVSVSILPPLVKERARVQLPDGTWIAHPASIQLSWVKGGSN